MIRNKLVVVLALLAVAVVAASAQGQSCQPGGQVQCGPFCLQYNLIADSGFNEDGCWWFTSPAYRATTGLFCGWTAPFAKIPYTGGQQVGFNQYVTALAADAGFGTKFSLSYTYEINDPNNNPANALEVWITQPNGFSMLVDQPPGGSQSCLSRYIDLGNHPEWAGQGLVVNILGTVANSNADIVVDNVTLQQRP